MSALLMLGFATDPPDAHANLINVTASPLIGCTLRRAVENHNAKGQPNKECPTGSSTDTIFVPAETVPVGGSLPAISGNLTITSQTANCVNLENTELTINPVANVTLWGIGIKSLTSFSGKFTRPVVDNNGGNLTIKSFSIHNCTFTRGHPGQLENGGILFNHNNGQSTIKGIVFDQSRTRGKGGAIYIESGNVTIGDSDAGLPSRFTGNGAQQGGAIYVNDQATLNVASSNFTFSGNEASNEGGAIYNHGGFVNIQRGGAPLANVSFASNKALNGAAIYSSGGKLSIDGIEFNNNSSNGSGGAVVVANAVVNPATISRCYFHNSSTNALGGGLYITSNSAVHLSASIFTQDRERARAMVFTSIGAS